MGKTVSPPCVFLDGRTYEHTFFSVSNLPAGTGRHTHNPFTNLDRQWCAKIKLRDCLRYLSAKLRQYYNTYRRRAVFYISYLVVFLSIVSQSSAVFILFIYYTSRSYGQFCA